MSLKRLLKKKIYLLFDPLELELRYLGATFCECYTWVACKSCKPSSLSSPTESI